MLLQGLGREVDAEVDIDEVEHEDLMARQLVPEADFLVSSHSLLAVLLIACQEIGRLADEEDDIADLVRHFLSCFVHCHAVGGRCS